MGFLAAQRVLVVLAQSADRVGMLDTGSDSFTFLPEITATLGATQWRFAGAAAVGTCVYFAPYVSGHSLLHLSSEALLHHTHTCALPQHGVVCWRCGMDNLVWRLCVRVCEYG